ncbi:LamG domain-containing protein [Streptomyces sp. DG2A-72]|uniref:LamG domain-containing protein n=1 Tax=Streptomyces sp. DG2A-72 TaxID=3051386 RepID=UPI00265B85BE|nr:LamG domain-containing protein [Streptomyces sp. DG2A-72]MDO0935565.1 LamG domain-containing protein [Streptomyces sp. DG2A-72]
MSGRFRKRRLLLGSCLAAVLGAAAPGTVYAAEKENLPPVVQDPQTGFKDCATGDTPDYVGNPPVLTARLTDPVEDDRVGYPEQLTAEFEIWWSDANGAEHRRSFTTSPAYPDRIHRINVPSDIPADTVISWHVRANDGTVNSAWSSETSSAACRFVYDDQSPAAPVVSSPEYPAETWWVGGVGVYGSFTMDSPSPDVVEYQYSFIGGPHGTVRPSETGGPATIRFVPLSNAPQRLSVQARDRSGRMSGRTDYTFFPKAASAPVSRWKLADVAGSTTAAAETGQAARAGRGVVFGGSVPSGTPLTSTATLDGSGHGFLTTDAPAVDSGKTFAVGAWVRPAETGRAMTVLSQDTASGTAYALGLEAPENATADWTFTLGGAKVTGGTPEAGEWAYVLGVYDTETGHAQLFVNGHEVGTKVKAAPVTADGAFQIGRIRGKNGYRQRWHGDIGDVRAYDRLVVPQEVTELAHRKPKLLGHWSFSTAADGITPEKNGGSPLRLGTGASINRGPDNSCLPDIDPDCPWKPYPLVGEGSLVLDGENGHAVLDAPAVDTGDSFTLGVVASIQDADATRPMTVLSQAGEHTEAFKLRYDPSTYAWQLIMPERDEAGAPETVVSQVTMPSGSSGQGTRLAIVYDDATDTVKLYADGHTNAGATAQLRNGWTSTGPLQVGRARTADGWGEYLKGDVDEVQAFAGALRDDDIIGLGHETEPCLCR